MNLEDRTLALAGIFQSAELVRQIARQGLIDQAPFESSIKSVLKLDAASTEEVYEGPRGIKMGLQILGKQLEPGGNRNMEIIHYVFGLIMLERKLRKREDLLETIREGIKVAIEQTKTKPVTHPDIIAQLAQLYSQTLSTFDYRLQVSGEPRYLDNQQNADKIRALLLTGIRSTVLWRQKGGNRWQFLFSRGKILRATKQHLEKINKLSR
jgi:high frequency lysogenization protein